MRLSAIGVLLMIFGLTAWAQQMPRMTTVEPANGKAGDVVTVTGENLDKAQVAKVFLTDGKNDIPVVVVEQEEKTLKIKVPAKAKGRFAIMLLTTGKEPKYVEQPVKLEVE